MTAENLVKALGNPGKFQCLVCIVLCFNYIYLCWNHLGMAFIGAYTKHHCRVGNKTDISNLVPLVKKNGQEQWDGCHLYADYNRTEKILCPNGWTYDLHAKEQTVISEWDLVCDNAYKVNLATTLYFCGVTLGTLVCGTLSDRFGRRPVFLICLYSPAFIGLVLLFINHYVAFVILRFILGFLVEGMQLVSYTIIMEMMTVKFRAFAGVTSSCFWALGVMSLALISYLIQDWRYIQLFTTVTSLLQIGLICFLPESFRWLLVKKRVDEARDVVEKVSTFNKLSFPYDVFEEVAAISCNETLNSNSHLKHYTILDVYRLPVLRKRSLILAWVWFSISLGYYGLALNVSSLAGNKYLNFFIGGVLEFIALVGTAFILERFGRHKPLCVYSFVGGVTCILAGVLPNNTDYPQELITALALCGRTFISGLFSIMFVYTSELYPTVIRNVGLGTGVFWGRFGSILAPQILLLAKYSTNAVLFVIFGGTVLLAALLGLMLPETLNKRLAETLEEAGNFEDMPKDSHMLRIMNDKDAEPQAGTRDGKS